MVPFTKMLLPLTDKLGCGTSILYELVPKVVTAAAPEATKEVLGVVVIVTVLPPLILTLFPIALKVGCGTLML